VIAGNIERVCKRLQKVLKPEQKRDGACDAPTLPGDRNAIVIVVRGTCQVIAARVTSEYQMQKLYLRPLRNELLQSGRINCGL
jgi:hypothetical protein